MFSAQGQSHNTEIFFDFFTMFKITLIMQKALVNETAGSLHQNKIHGISYYYRSTVNK